MFVVNSYVWGCTCTHVVDRSHVGYFLSPFILFLQTGLLLTLDLFPYLLSLPLIFFWAPSFSPSLSLFHTSPPFFSFEIIINSHGAVPNKNPGSFYLASSKDYIPFFPFKLYITYSWTLTCGVLTKAFAWWYISLVQLLMKWAKYR